jgi:hypothetical protein
MNDDAVGLAFDDIAALLPPRATEYRSAAVSARLAAGNRDEPATIPLTTLPPTTVPPAPGGTVVAPG